MERGTGIEPATSSLGSWRSTAELTPLGTLIVTHSDYVFDSSYLRLNATASELRGPFERCNACCTVSRCGVSLALYFDNFVTYERGPYGRVIRWILPPGIAPKSR